jgi:transposase
LSEQQREAAVALFEDGHAAKSAAARVAVSVHAVRKLHHRWLLRGAGALIMKPTRASYSFEFKLDVVRPFLNGEATAAELAREHDLSSPNLVKTWARQYRTHGEDALRPKPRGRPPGDPKPPETELSEVQRLRRENEYLAAENAYLKKLRALRAQRRG